MTNSSSAASPKGRYLAYLRVSTQKQGEGVSLITQRETIASFAARKKLLVSGWFEEKETAAKRGRRVFAEVLKALRSRKADGLIVYKVNRSARPAGLGRSWRADRPGHPGLLRLRRIDVSSRGGRLAADTKPSSLRTSSAT